MEQNVIFLRLFLTVISTSKQLKLPDLRQGHEADEESYCVSSPSASLISAQQASHSLRSIQSMIKVLWNTRISRLQVTRRFVSSLKVKKASVSGGQSQTVRASSDMFSMFFIPICRPARADEPSRSSARGDVYIQPSAAGGASLSEEDEASASQPEPKPENICISSQTRSFLQVLC